MKLEIYKPEQIPKEYLEQLYDLISEGGQVDRHYVEIGVPNALCVGILFDDDTIISTATIKNPLGSYIEGVFEDAGVPELLKSYQLELGYIVTREGHGGKGYCKALLSEMMPLVGDRNVFATTRKDSMGHILGKYGFSKVGSVYKGDLELFVKSTT
ncbi:MAG: hypothetical protein U0U70_08040 [Chitinophagaceae bacterium]